MSPEKYLLDWQTSQTNAESISPLLGQLYRQKGVEILLFGRQIVNASVIDIIKAHRVARRYTGSELSPSQTLPLIQALTKLDLSPC
ncbi:glyceraldehyde-3-phosphate dehydrogenase, partial [Photobacterium sp. OFAV2-7]|nr:glyceraldehyde-3-phosphate dehydrogenase [Photobacterium sp. OFAV2-7]